MAEQDDNLDMSLFLDQEIELNLDLGPEIPEEVVTVDPKDTVIENVEGTPEEVIETPEGTSAAEQNNLGEGEDPENVAEEGHQDDGDDAVDSPNLYSSFATALDEQGLFPSLDLKDNKVETIDDLTSLLKDEISNQTKQYLIDKVGEKGYDALEKGLSLTELQQSNATIETLDNITEEDLGSNIELAKKIILQDYVNQGITETRALRILGKSVDVGDEAVIEDAVESLKSLRVFEEERVIKVAESREIEAEKIDNDLKNSIYNNKEFIEGYPVTKEMQDKVYQSITKIVGQAPGGVAENKLMQQRRENPIDFDTKLYYIFELTNGFKDLSKLEAKTTTKATVNLEKALRQTKFGTGTEPAFLNDPESYGGIGSELVI